MSDDFRPYNPLDKKNLGKSITDAILELEMQPLNSIPSFIGAGIYAIYYKGRHDLYKEIGIFTNSNPKGFPIYVGKAIPEGGRKGGYSATEYSGSALSSRLNNHAKSISYASDLNIEDFSCRYLILDDIWIPLGENLLIEAYQPVWNHIIEGFGNNDPGNRRATQYRSIWDSIHKGRPWANKLADNDQSKIDKAIEKLKEHIRKTINNLNSGI